MDVVTRILLQSDHFFSQARESRAMVIAGVTLTVALLAWLVRGRRASVALIAAAFVLFGFYAYWRVFRFAMGRLGHHLPTVTLLAPATGEKLGNEIVLRAHAIDAPGALGPVPAVRMIEFWLYHPSFREQHAGNHESKVFLGQVPGPTADDQYATSWTCANPYTPPRDGDHSGGDGTRTYVLPSDGRPYQVQAHGLDDEWHAKHGAPGRSELVQVAFEPCK